MIALSFAHPVIADSLAKLFVDYFFVPFADIGQVLAFVAMVATAVQRGLAHQDEHWGHTLLRPVGVGISILGLIEICKVAAAHVLAGTLTI
jgi:hypothetical protein